jgi:6-phosphofructokinase 2
MGKRETSPGAVTLTMNPAIDLCATVDRLAPTRKLRCHDLRRDPGGGGINVARAMRRLGGRALAVFPAGGPTGARLEAMLRAERAPHRALRIAGETREDFTAQVAATGEQYRFVLPGPRVSRAECAAVLDLLGALQPKPQILVASGSLPPGAPISFYGRLAAFARGEGIRLALDAAGPALRHGLAAGVWLVKPSLAELEELAAAALPDLESRLGACRRLVETNAAELVALSMGAEGALLVDADEAWLAPAPRIAPLSTVGAGDSFTAGLVRALASGAATPSALAEAVAAGSAALLAPGTQLCRPADVQSLLKRIRPALVWRAGVPSATRRRPAAA